MTVPALTSGRPLFRRPWLLLPCLAALLLLGWFTFNAVGSGFMPKMDEGGFVLDFRSAPGTSLAETTRELAQVEAILNATPEVETYSTHAGVWLGDGLTVQVDPARAAIEGVDPQLVSDAL